MLFDAVALLPSADGAARPRRSGERAGLRQRRLRPPQARRDGRRRRRPARRGRAWSRTRASSTSPPPTTPPSSSPAAPRCGTGSATSVPERRPVLLGGRTARRAARARRPRRAGARGGGRRARRARARRRGRRPSCRCPAAGAPRHLWSALASVAAADLTVARTLEPHLDALAILGQAGVPAEPGTWGVFAAEGPGEPLRADGRRDGVRPRRAQALVLARRRAGPRAGQRAGRRRAAALRGRPDPTRRHRGDRHVGGARARRGRLRTGGLRGRAGDGRRRAGVVPRAAGLRLGRHRGRRRLVRRCRRHRPPDAGRRGREPPARPGGADAPRRRRRPAPRGPVRARGGGVRRRRGRG